MILPDWHHKPFFRRTSQTQAALPLFMTVDTMAEAAYKSTVEVSRLTCLLAPTSD